MNDGLQFRAFSAPSDGQARATLSTEAPVPMFDFHRGEFVPEILAADGMRVRGSADQVPMLDTHSKSSVDDVLGSIREIESRNGEVTGVPHFDAGERGASAKSKVDDGHITDLSVGYTVNRDATIYIGPKEKREYRGQEYNGPLNIRTEWEMFEVSLVPIGADAAAKMRGFEDVADAKRKISDSQRNSAESQAGEGAGGDRPESQSDEGSSSAESAKPEAVAIMQTETIKKVMNDNELKAEREKASAEARAAEVKRMDKIRDIAGSLGKKIDDPDAWARTHIEKGTKIDAVMEAAEVIREWPEPKTIDEHNAEAHKRQELDISDKEMRQYSLSKAILEFASNQRVSGFEAEVSQEVAKNSNKEPQGFFIPAYNMGVDQRAAAAARMRGMVGQRDSPYLAGTDTTLVGTDHRADLFIDVLRNRLVATQLGVRTIGGLVGNVSIPTRAAGVSTGWVNESTALPVDGGTFGSRTGTPHTLGAQTAYSKQLLAQGLPDVDMLVRDDLISDIAVEKDAAILGGSGVGAVPEGAATAATGSVTVTAGAPTWAQVVEFETALGAANADIGSLAYVTNAAGRGLLKSAKKDDGSGLFLWDGDMMNGYRAVATNGLAGDLLMFGNWNDALSLDWDGIDIVADEYTAAAERQVKVTAFIFTDVIIRRPASFAVSTAAITGP